MQWRGLTKYKLLCLQNYKLEFVLDHYSKENAKSPVIINIGVLHFQITNDSQVAHTHEHNHCTLTHTVQTHNAE